MKVVILGAGPAGLAAALALTKHGHAPIVLEMSGTVGGLCRTVSHNDYLFDIGGHRFFTKFDEVQALWEDILGDDLLLRPRLSRIYYEGKFYDYPLRASNALRNLGLRESARCVLSYGRARLRGRGDEQNFEEWVSNRFGYRLFDIFFRSYTEKVWGIPTNEIGADWAAQRIKNMELSTAIIGALRRPLGRMVGERNDVASLIEEFHYPRRGPGMMYDAMAQRIEDQGGEIRRHAKVTGLAASDGTITGVTVETAEGTHTLEADHVMSSIPLTSLVKGMDPPPEIAAAVNALSYRNLLTVNLIIDAPELFPDNWIYVHEPALQLGRIQNYKNWSPEMVPDATKTSLGLEYFCSNDEAIWSMDDDALIAMATAELHQTGLIGSAAVVDGCVVRAPRAYPVYSRGYDAHLASLVEFVGRYRNLHPMGRYGMFKYNNSDHSILTALLSVENILGAQHRVWDVNTETEYHEIRS